VEAGLVTKIILSVEAGLHD